jgi:type III secretion protein T
VVAVALATARLGGLVLIFPVFARVGLTGLVRGGIVVGLALPLLPAVLSQIDAAAPLGPFLLVALVFKEALVGFLLGMLYGVPFWGAQAGGDIIDQQRGANQATLNEADNLEEASVTGTLFVLVLIMLFVVSNGFHLLLGGVYDSYLIWPARNFLPNLSTQSAWALVSLLDRVMLLGLVIAGPVIAALFLVDLSLGLVNRFAPQLNVFNLSLAAKSFVYAVVMPLYVLFLMDQLHGDLAPLRDVLTQMKNFLP